MSLSIEEVEQALIESAIKWSRANSRALNNRDILLRQTVREVKRKTRRADELYNEEKVCRKILFKTAKSLDMLRSVE